MERPSDSHDADDPEAAIADAQPLAQRALGAEQLVA
jgi:hypothetical protein